MSNEFIHEHRVGFSETDAAGIAHFSRFLIWVENAEAAFWRGNGLSVPITTNGVMCGFPKIKSEVRHRLPARAGDLVEVILSPNYAGRTSVVWRFKIMCGEHVLADGELTVIYATIELATGKMRRATVPAEWAKFLNNH